MATLLISSAIQLGVGFGLNLLFRPDQPDIVQDGPRLSDLSVSTSSYGTAIPIHEGSTRTQANLIWGPDIKETVTSTTEEIGKGGGGGSVTTNSFTYSADMAWSFGEGVAKDVLKIWANSKLIFDKTGSGLTSSKYKFRFYTGDETQVADPLIEAREGVGNVPAFRGTTYMVCEDWPLADFGNGRPNVTALIAYEATDSAPFTTLTELASFTLPDGGNEFIQLDPFSDDLYTFAAEGIVGIARSSLNGMVMQAGTNGPFIGYSSVFGADGFAYAQRNSSSNWTSLFKYDPVSFQVLATYGGDGATCTFTTDGCMPNGSKIGTVQIGDPSSGTVKDFVVFVSDAAVSAGGVKVLQQSGNVFFQIFVDTSTGLGTGGNVIQDRFNRRVFVVQNDATQAVLYEVDVPANFNAAGLSLGPITLRLVGTYLKDGSALSGTNPADADCLIPDENAVIISNGTSMIKVDLDDGVVLANNITTGFRSRQQWATEGIFAFPRNGSSTVIDTIDTDDLTVVASESVSLTGLPAFAANARAAYDPRNHSIVYARVAAGTDRVVRVFLDRRTADGVALDGVVTRVLQRVGVVATDMDLSALTALTVRGYSITKPMTARGALEPLQTAFLFDIVESDFKLKAVLRGGSVVKTIAEDDIGLLDANQDPFSEESRLHEEEMPLSSVIRYWDIDADYQQSAQTERRVAEPTASQNAQSTLTIELPIVLTSTEAKQIAQKLLYTKWAERAEISSSFDWSQIVLDPADVIELTEGTEIRRVRLEQVELGADLEIRFKAVVEDARSSQSTLVGDAGGFIKQVPPSLLPTKFLGLDLPLLTDADAPFQAFVQGYYGLAAFDDGWPGAVLFQSRDGGATFTEIGAGVVESTYGVTKVIVADPGSLTTWDESSTVTLSVQRGISRFVSSTDLEVLNGANAVSVITAAGPEIIQFVTVTQTDASTVVLSRLLRGRLGTEPNSTGHALGERFVLLELGRVRRFGLPLDLRNSLLEYRAPTIGQPLENSQKNFFTYTGEDLTPYSVSHLRATRTGNDFQATWTRRTRFGGQLLDGTDASPLNEAAELYDVDVLLGDVAVQSIVDQSATQYDLLLTTFTGLGFVQAQFPFLNPDFETSAGWVFPQNGIYLTSSGSVVPQSGIRMLGFNNGAIAGAQETANQSIRLSDAGYDTFVLDNLAVRPAVTLRYYENSTSGNDAVQVILEFRQENETVLGSIDTGFRTPALNSWVQVVQAGTLPVGTRKIRLRVICDPIGGLGVADNLMDNVQCDLGTDMSPLTIRVYQKSAIVGRGRLTEELL